jgi:hypothetical protein
MYETSPWEDTARIAAISGLAEKGDVGELADVLMLRAHDWHEGIGVNSRLRELSREQRFALAQLFVGHANKPGRGRLRPGLLVRDLDRDAGELGSAQVLDGHKR